MSRGPGKTQRAILDKLEAHLAEHPLLEDFEPNGNLRTTRDGHPPSFLTVAQLAGDDATRSATVSYRRALNALNRDGHVFLYYGHNRVMGARIIHDTEDDYVWRKKLHDWNLFKWQERHSLETYLEYKDQEALDSRSRHHDPEASVNVQMMNLYREQMALRSVSEFVEYNLAKGYNDVEVRKYGATIAEREQAYRDEYNAPPEAENDATPPRMPDEVAALMEAMHGQP